MNEPAIKAKLERALHRGITQPEWRHLKRAWLGPGVLSEDQLARDAAEDWQEFRNFAEEQLRLLRSYEEDKISEQDGEFEPEMTPDLAPDQLPDGASSLSDRTFERGTALGYLNRLRTDGRSSGRSTIHGTLLPRGGVDGTLAQWVNIIAAELWVPAEDVMRTHRSMQRALLADPNPPKTQTRAFKVAQFVWENERVHGKRPPWPVLWQRWNSSPFGQLAGPFKSWRDMRTYFLRGSKATPPRYIATNEQMAELVRSRSHQEAFDIWAAKVRH